MATTLLLFDANSFVLPASNPPGRDVVQNRPFVAFDDTTEETCYTQAVKMPQSYGGGTLAAKLPGMFASETTVTNEAVLAVSVEAITIGDGVDMDAGGNFDSENTCEIDPPDTVGKECEGSATLTNKDSVAVGDLVRFKIARKVDAAADTASGDFRLLCMEIQES
jgi:hypothetical protein